MIYIQQVFNDDYSRVGYSTVDTNNSETFWVTYTDYELSQKVGKPIMFKNMPYRRGWYNPWMFGKIIETIE